MSDMIPDTTPEAPTPTAPAKNRGGRPRKTDIDVQDTQDSLQNILQATMAQLDKLISSDKPSPAKARLLQSKFEFYSAQQAREDRAETANLSKQNQELRLQVEQLEQLQPR